MGILAVIGITYIIWKLIDEQKDQVSHPGKMNFERMQHDTTEVALGNMSKKEMVKRERSGYYMDK